MGKDGSKRYFARKEDCATCPLKPPWTPKEATRKISRSRHESARQKAREIATTDAYVVSGYARKKVEMLFAHLKRILRLDRLRLRGHSSARDKFLLAATVQNLRKLTKLIKSDPAAVAANGDFEPLVTKDADGAVSARAVPRFARLSISGLRNGRRAASGEAGLKDLAHAKA